MTDLTLYCNCTPTLLAKEQQFNQINLVCHSSSLDPRRRAELQTLNYKFDDTGDNISQLNSDYGDLTGLYWVWKNTDHEFVGTNQYRRFWNEQEIKHVGLRSNTVYVYKISLTTDTLRQFLYYHGVILPQLLYEASTQQKIDVTPELIMSMQNINYVYACNMFFCEREVFNNICEKFFEIMDEIYQGSKYALPYIDTGPGRHRRGLAFLAERVLTLMLLKKDYYFGSLELQPIGVRVV